MLIANARLVKNTEEKLVNIQDVSKHLYDTKFRGFLYCPTPGCPAKLVYINSERAHFRTWKYYAHHEGCVYHLEKRLVEQDLKLADVTVGFEFERRQMALSRAYRMMKYPEESSVLQNVNRAIFDIQKPKLSRHKSKSGIQTKLFDDETWQSLIRKSPPLRSKYVSEIKRTDIGKQMLVMGFIHIVELIEDVAKITLLESDKEIEIVFEQAFIAESKNNSYLNNFGVIQHFADQSSEFTFTGIGEVRFNRTTNRFELQIFYGTDFRIEDIDLVALSAKMTLSEME